VDLSQIRHLVLDEADRMLDMGFIHDIRRILKLLPAKRQNLMFSATYTPDIRALASRILVNPVQVEVTPPNSTVDRVVQLAFRVAKDDKRHLLVHLFQNGVNGEGRWEQALVFTRTKHGANRLSQQLEQAARARRLQGRQADRAGRDRGRLARSRHPRAAAGRELRHAACAGGLRASHRPHRARRQ
jgi:ATP-dependent RNA helicase RhlE